MAGSASIDLVIGLVVVLGVTAGLCSVITEVAARFLGLRGRYLLRGLVALLDGDGAGADLADVRADYAAMKTLIRQRSGLATTGTEALADTAAYTGESGPRSVTGALLGSPILRGEGVTGQVFSWKQTTRQAWRIDRRTRMAWSKGRGLPSYISARSFTEALIDLVVPDAAGQATMGTILHSVTLLPDSMSTLRASLQALGAGAQDDIGLFRAAVEHWYDDHMDRVSGWYKRHVAKITTVVGAIVVLLLNINTLTIGRTLYSDSVVRTAVNAVATNSTSCPAGPDQQACLANLQAQLSAAANSGLPIGWPVAPDCGAPRTSCNWLDQRGIFSPHGGSGWQVVLVLVGFLITIAVLVPGAQAWFGLLGRLRKRRSVPRPEPQPESEPVPSAAGADAGGAGTRPPPTGGGPDGFFGWFRRFLEWLRRVFLHWLARRSCNVTGFIGQRTADEAASARRRRVEQALYGPGQPMRLELPDELSSYREADQEISRHEAAARQVTLEWQLSEPQLLLLARVCDTVEVLMRRLESPADQDESSGEERGDIRKLHLVVTLQPVPETARRLAPDVFPWRVVVKTGDPTTLGGMLRQYATWYGVSVHVTKGRPVRRTGRCVHAGGMDGTIGGIVQIGNESYGLTCAHVVGADCPSIKTPVRAESDVWSPDAVLLQLDGRCLAAPEEPWRIVAPVTWTEANKLVKTHAVARMRTVRGRVRTGNVQVPALLFGDEDGYVEFPTVEIQRTPGLDPFPRPFSKPGDSGTWVTLRDGVDQWVGMVVGGNPGGNTFCHLSGPLLRWLEILLSDAPQPPVEEEGWFKGKNELLAIAKMTLSGEENEQH